MIKIPKTVKNKSVYPLGTQIFVLGDSMSGDIKIKITTVGVTNEGTLKVSATVSKPNSEGKNETIRLSDTKYTFKTFNSLNC